MYQDEFNELQKTLREKYTELYKNRTRENKIPKNTIIYELGENDPFFIDNGYDCIEYNVGINNFYETKSVKELNEILSNLYLPYIMFFDKLDRILLIDEGMIKKSHFDILNNVSIKTSNRMQAVLVNERVFEALDDVLYLGTPEDSERQAEVFTNVIEDYLVKVLKCTSSEDTKKLAKLVLEYADDESNGLYEMIDDTINNVNTYGIDKVILEMEYGISE